MCDHRPRPGSSGQPGGAFPREREDDGAERYARDRQQHQRDRPSNTRYTHTADPGRGEFRPQSMVCASKRSGTVTFRRRQRLVDGTGSFTTPEVLS
ncbi:MAG: hypothetical protein JO181_20350 [Solirubrobacterales bacterium]|nr:hypothetical protein [Solirubrobacterales bacterium]